MSNGGYDHTRVIGDQRSQAWYHTVDWGVLVAVVGSLAGVFVLIVAIVTLARTGLPGDLTEARTFVGPYDRTAVMGLIEILVGMIFIGAGASRHASGLFALGLLASVFGIVWLIEPNAFNDLLGVNRATAWTYLFIGVVSAVVGGMATNVSTTSRR